MKTLQHVYRRGHIFWWRRVHRISDGWTLDVRISLRTSDRCEARNRGAALTAATGEIVQMLHQRIRAADARPTEAELRAIAREAYGQRLAQFCAEQRQMPQHGEAFGLSNRTFADLYQRMIDNGGHVPITVEEETALIQKWGKERVENLEALSSLVDAGYKPIKLRFADGYLRDLGYGPHDGLRRMVMPLLFEAYRDACRDAEAVRQGYQPVSRFSEPEPVTTPAPVVVTTSAVHPSEPVEMDGPFMSDLIDQAIADNIVEDIWDTKSGRQARSTVALFELLIGKKPFAAYTQSDFSTFKRKMRFLPDRYDMTSAKSREQVLLVVAEREQDPEFQKKDNKEARSNRTRNRHISSLRGVHRWAEKNDVAVPSIKFESLFIRVSKTVRGRKLRPATTRDDVAALFALPVYTGCARHAGGTGQKVLSARFTPGDTIVHDAYYWVPLLLYYTGARREEICKLRPEDVHQLGDIPYIFIDFTEFGRLKNDHSIRPVPLHSELIRLGFMAFVEECRNRGYDVLFPELRPTNAVQVFGDVYYKNAWSHLKKKGQLTSEATVHGMRHRFSTDLKAKKVFSEFRRDLMGHAGANLNEEVYSDIGPLTELQAIVQELPSATDLLLSAQLNLPPRAVRKPQPAKRRKSN